jgi:uncharacterized protein
MIQKMATLSLRPPDLNQTVASLKKILGDRLIAVVLFGSWARGDAREDSDWDRFVIAQDLPERPFPRHLFFVNQLPPECRAGVSILAKTREEFESLLSSLYLDIALDGKILYDPHGYINEKLTYVRDLLRQKGLRRERIGRDFAWRWEKYPGFGWSLTWEGGEP